jgi:hypothetical protein
VAAPFAGLLDWQAPTKTSDKVKNIETRNGVIETRNGFTSWIIGEDIVRLALTMIQF